MRLPETALQKVFSNTRHSSRLTRFSFVLWLSLALPPHAFAENAATEETSFTKQCPKLLEIADDFAHECLQKARTNSRTFYPGGALGLYGKGQKETHSAYFRAVDSGSHFGLGCTLNEKHEINFLGIYYSTKSSNFAEANTAPIRFIDAQANVGLTINNEPIILLPIRQFSTDSIPLLYKGLDPKDIEPNTVIDPNRINPPKNCEGVIAPDGRLKDHRGGGEHVTENKSLIQGQYVIEACNDIAKQMEHGCQINRYVEFLTSKNRQLIFQGDASFWFLRDGGDLLIKEGHLRKSCSITTRNGLNIAYEVCDKVNVQK